MAASSQIGNSIVRNPFKGLVPYTANDPLFGRDADVELIQSRFWSSRLTILFAGSGAGKSSFLNAKLVPALRRTFGDGNVAFPQGWARTAPDEAVAEIIAKLSKSSSRSPNGAVLVLDQFEEVLQHFPNPAMLSRLGKVLASVADEESNLNVRVLIATREEFLAELTIFDDFIPGLLTNYYRLNMFTPEQATLVVKKTAKLGGVTVSSAVEMLIRDLQSVKEGSYGQSAGYVDPPYLQIVCQRIWNREGPVLKGTEFLCSYKEGDARKELDSYCRENLRDLSFREKALLKTALGHLTGPNEAKKWVRLPELAQQSRTRNQARLGRILKRLSDPAIRIFREWEEIPAGGKGQKPEDRVEVYELYHDMYAPMLWRWRAEQEARERQRALAKLCMVMAVLLLILVPVFFYLQVKGLLERTRIGDEDDLTTVRYLRNSLSVPTIGSRLGNNFWKSYTQHQFILAALRYDYDAALEYRLAELAIEGEEPTSETVHNVMGSAQSLVGTYRSPNVDHNIVDAAIANDNTLLVGTGNAIYRYEINGTKQDMFVRVYSKKQKNAKSQENRVSILSFSPKGDKLVATWYDPQQHEYKIAIFPLQEQIHAQIHEKNIEILPDKKTIRSIPISVPSYQIGNLLIPMKAVFAGRYVALIADYDQNLFLYDYDSPASAIRPIVSETNHGPQPLGQVDQVAFIDDEHFIFTIVDVSSDDRHIWFGTVQGNERRESSARLPSRSRLIVDPGRGVLGEKNGTWGWLSSPDSFHPIGLKRRYSIPELWPQSWDSVAKVLLCLDITNELLVVDESGNSTLRLPAGTLRSNLKLHNFSSASLVHFTNQPREFISIDDDGEKVHWWRMEVIPTTHLPEVNSNSIVSSDQQVNCEQQESGSGGHDSNAKFYSIDCFSKAYIEGNILHIESKDGKKWAHELDSLPDNQQIGITVSSTGQRALVWLEDKILYITRDNSSSLARENFREGVFGPGSDRVTLLSDHELVIQRFTSGKSAPGRQRKAEWKADAQHISFLRNGNENSVVICSPDWVHKFTADAAKPFWPIVNSRILDNIPNTDALLPERKPNEFRPQNCPLLKWRDINRSDIIEVIGTNQTLSFSAADDRGKNPGIFASALSSLKMLYMGSCRFSAGNNVPHNWHDVMCNWKVRSGRAEQSD